MMQLVITSRLTCNYLCKSHYLKNSPGLALLHGLSLPADIISNCSVSSTKVTKLNLPRQQDCCKRLPPACKESTHACVSQPRWSGAWLVTPSPLVAAGELVRHPLTAGLGGEWVWWSPTCEQGRCGKRRGVMAGVTKECPGLPQNPNPGVG